MTWVRPCVWNKPGRFSEECVGADTAWVGRRDADGLARGFAAEWGQEEGVWLVIRARVVTRIGEVGGVNVEALGRR